MAFLPETINAKYVSAFVDSDYEYIEANLEKIQKHVANSSAVDLLADIAILKGDRRLMKYLDFHHRYLIDKYKNSPESLEFLLEFMKTDLGDDFRGFERYNYYFEDVTDRKTFDLYHQYGLKFDMCDVIFIEPELQELAIRYGAPDRLVTLERFIKYVESDHPDLPELVMDEIGNDFERYFEKFSSCLSEDLIQRVEESYL